MLSKERCDGHDAANLMFWSAVRGATTLTAQQAASIRRAVACEQLEAAREEHHRCLADESVGLSWLAQDRVWYWSLHFQAAELLS